MRHKGFEAFLSLSKNGEVIGAYWYYPLQISDVASELCQELADFAKDQLDQHDLPLLIYEKALFIDPFYQGQGIARQLRETGLAHIPSLYHQTRVLLLARHREDNEAIIHLSKQMGFSDTDITMQVVAAPGPLRKFFYKIT